MSAQSSATWQGKHACRLLSTHHLILASTQTSLVCLPRFPPPPQEYKALAAQKDGAAGQATARLEAEMKRVKVRRSSLREGGGGRREYCR